MPAKETTVTLSKAAYDAQMTITAKLRQEIETLKKAQPTDNTPADDVLAELQRLRQENQALIAARAAMPKNIPTVSFKVSEKGGVSIYGLGRFPVTLYKEQWTKLLDFMPHINAFIQEHDSELKTKPAKE